MLSVVRGAALLVTNGEPVTVNTSKGGREEVINQFYFLGQGHLFDRIPMLLMLFILIALEHGFFFRKRPSAFGFTPWAEARKRPGFRESRSLKLKF